MTASNGAFPGELDSLVSTLKGGLGSIPPSAAVQAIDDWHQKLQGVGSPELSSIASELGALKSQLTAGSLDNQAISQTLHTLSTKVAALSGNGGAGSKLGELSDALKAGAASL